MFNIIADLADAGSERSHSGEIFNDLTDWMTVFRIFSAQMLAAYDPTTFT